MTNLQSLELRDNKIDMMDEDFFYGLKKLKILGISNNKLKYIIITTFKRLTMNIQTFYLDRNEISDIEPYSFSNMTDLVDLNSQMNRLKSIRNRTFSIRPIY